MLHITRDLLQIGLMFKNLYFNTKVHLVEGREDEALNSAHCYTEAEILLGCKAH